MIPSFRLLLLLLIEALFIAGSTFTSSLWYITGLYFVTLVGLVTTDFFITARPSQIDIERINDSKLSLGAPNIVTLILSNRSTYTIHFNIRDEYPYQFSCDTRYIEGTIAPYTICEKNYYVYPFRRGDYQFGNANLRYRSILGTFIRQATYNIQASVKVYPNILEVRKYDLMVRKGLLHELGLRQSRLFGSGTEFERLREYNTDDEFRRINWKATARRGKPIAIEYETERSQFVISLIDTGRLMRPMIGNIAKLDYVINTALLVSYVATLKGDHVGMLTFADEVGSYIAPKRGKGQFYRMLEALYNVESSPVEPDYAYALSYLSTKHKRRSLIIVFTDVVTLEAAKPLIANLTRLAQRHLTLCVTISDPDISHVTTQDIHDSNSTYQRAVAEMLLDERQVLLDTLHVNGILTVDVPADKLTVSVINTYLNLKQRGAL